MTTTTVLRNAGKQFTVNELTDRAAALTYYSVLAIFPGLLVIVAGLGMLDAKAAQTLLDNVGAVAPKGVHSFLSTVVGQAQQHSAAGIAAVVGLLLAIWSASGYVSGFMRASNAIYEVREGRPFWRLAPTRYLVTLAAMVMLMLSAVIVLVTGGIAQQVGKMLGVGDTAVQVWDVAKWPVLLVLVSLIFSLLYWACPNVKVRGYKLITPGGIAAVLIWLIASAGFGIYTGFAGSYNKTYGSLATVIIFLVWLWISNCAILFGAQLNAEFERRRAVNAGLPADVDTFVPLRDLRTFKGEELAKATHAQAVLTSLESEAS